jgi:hypothetical protein
MRMSAETTKFKSCAAKRFLTTWSILDTFKLLQIISRDKNYALKNCLGVAWGGQKIQFNLQNFKET